MDKSIILKVNFISDGDLSKTSKKSYGNMQFFCPFRKQKQESIQECQFKFQAVYNTVSFISTCILRKLAFVFFESF